MYAVSPLYVQCFRGGWNCWQGLMTVSWKLFRRVRLAGLRALRMLFRASRLPYFNLPCRYAREAHLPPVSSRSTPGFCRYCVWIQDQSSCNKLSWLKRWLVGGVLVYVPHALNWRVLNLKRRGALYNMHWRCPKFSVNLFFLRS